MSRLNALGKKILECHTEYQNTTSLLIKEALNVYIQDLLQNTVADPTIIVTLKDETIKAKDFEKLLLEKPGCCVTIHELMTEFEKKESSILEQLSGRFLYEIEKDEDKEVVRFGIKLGIGEEFAMNYFGVDSNEAFKLMKRQGFMEKFAALRLSKLGREILQELNKTKPSIISIDASYVHFSEDTKLYGTDIIIELHPEDALENEEELVTYLKYASEVIENIVTEKLF